MKVAFFLVTVILTVIVGAKDTFDQKVDAFVKENSDAQLSEADKTTLQSLKKRVKEARRSFLKPLTLRNLFLWRTAKRNGFTGDHKIWKTNFQDRLYRKLLKTGRRIRAENPDVPLSEFRSILGANAVERMEEAPGFRTVAYNGRNQYLFLPILGVLVLCGCIVLLVFAIRYQMYRRKFLAALYCSLLCATALLTMTGFTKVLGFGPRKGLDAGDLHLVNRLTEIMVLISLAMLCFVFIRAMNAAFFGGRKSVVVGSGLILGLTTLVTSVYGLTMVILSNFTFEPYIFDATRILAAALSCLFTLTLAAAACTVFGKIVRTKKADANYKKLRLNSFVIMLNAIVLACLYVTNLGVICAYYGYSLSFYHRSFMLSNSCHAVLMVSIFFYLLMSVFVHVRAEKLRTGKNGYVELETEGKEGEEEQSTPAMYAI